MRIPFELPREAAEREARVALHVAQARAGWRRGVTSDDVLDQMAERGVPRDQARRALERLVQDGSAARVPGGWRPRVFAHEDQPPP